MISEAIISIQSINPRLSLVDTVPHKGKTSRPMLN